jgi:glucuronokinase
MVELARSAGASAKFTGSGGAIIGTYQDNSMYDNLKNILSRKNITIIKPEIL